MWLSPSILLAQPQAPAPEAPRAADTSGPGPQVPATSEPPAAPALPSEPTPAATGAPEPEPSSATEEPAPHEAKARSESAADKSDAGGPTRQWEDLTLEELLSVEVTVASRKAVRSLEAPSVVTVIPRTTIDAHGFRSVGEALSIVPGFYVLYDLITYNVGVRGMYLGPESYSRLIKVLINDRPATFYATGGTFLGPEFIPIDLVQRIEVIRGPGSALYGANAFLGVINVVTTEPDTAGASLKLGGEVAAVRNNLGGAAHATAAVATAPQSAPTRALVTFGMSGEWLNRSGLSAPASSPYADMFAGTKSRHDLSQPSSVFARASFISDELGRLNAQVSRQRLDSYAEFSDISVLTHRTRRVLDNLIVSLDYNKAFLEDHLRLRSFATFTRGEEPAKGLDVGEPNFTVMRERSNEAINPGLELTLDETLGSVELSLLAGADYLRIEDSGDTVRHQFADTGDQLLVQRNNQFTSENWGAYSQLTVRPLDRLGLTAGARFDDNTQAGSSLSYRLAGVLTPLDKLYVKAMYATSFVPPAPAQLYGRPLAFGDSLTGNPDLKSQRAATAEVSASYQFSSNLGASLTGFHTRVHNRVEFRTSGNFVTAQNQTPSESIGAEATADWRWFPLNSQVGLSMQHTTTEQPTPIENWWIQQYGSNQPGGARSLSYPVWTVHSTLGATLHDLHLQPNVLLRAVGSRKASSNNIQKNQGAYLLPAYALLDVNMRTVGILLAGRPLDLSLHIQNLLDTRYAEPGFRGVDIPALGRTVFLKVAYQLY
jgi:iron complex outermembrane receptor protein